MRKLVVSMNLSLDGFCAGPDGELDWHLPYWSEDMAEALGAQLSRGDTLLLGRNTYSAMAAYWSAKAHDLGCSRDDIALAMALSSYAKVVVTRCRTLPQWGKAEPLRGSIAAGVRRLKAAGGKDIITYGSLQLVAGLAELDLVDEFRLWLHPVAICKGLPLFKPGGAPQALHLIDARAFSSGVVLLTYEVVREK